MVEYTPSNLSQRERYKVLTSFVLPRPIAWVTTVGPTGVVNAAPFSFFNVFCEDPPLCMFAANNRPDGRPKDTLVNIRHTGEFVVNLVDEPLAEAMNICATDFPPETSELEAVGLATAPSVHVAPPRIVEAPAALECRRELSLNFGPHRELLIGRVLHVHVRPEVMDAAYNVDMAAYRPVGRLFANLYAHQSEVFALERLSHGEWQRRRAVESQAAASADPA